MNKITYRNLTFTHADLVEGNCNTQHAMTGESLACDTLDFVVYSETDPLFIANFLTADGETFLTSDEEIFQCIDAKPLTDFIPGDVIQYYIDDVLINRFYLTSVKREGRGLYRFSCVSAIGLIDKSYHAGGIYAGTDIGDVLAEIFDGLDYEIDPLVQTIKLYGWLPYDTKRNNLQQITIATALSIRTKSDGTIRITALTSDIKGSFGADRCVVGGSVDAGSPCTAVQVTEHAFTESTEEITLCDESFVTTKLILFPEPAHTLSITGGTIISSGANYAIIEGAGTVVLTGKKYLHTIKRVAVGNVSGSASDNVLTVSNATLVTTLNSFAVAEKLYSAFSPPTTVKQDVLFGSERVGDVVSVINPYTAVTEKACARKMDIHFGNLTTATGEFVVDYEPSGVITGYQHKEVLTSGQTWVVPEGVTEIRAILIGGGQGGQGGYNGASGGNGSRLPTTWGEHDGVDYVTEYFNGAGGAGGVGGLGGAGGNVVDAGAITVTPAQTISVTIGAGGAGGASNGGEGSAGGDTTFGAFSTNGGTPPPTGYADILEGSIYGISGQQAPDGATGRGKNTYGASRIVEVGLAPVYLVDGGKVEVLNGAQGNSSWLLIQSFRLYGIGGSGGGASWINNGGNGGGGGAEYNDGWGDATGGNGGTGAAGSQSMAQTIRGSGGHGGAGGGGGGGGGAYLNVRLGPGGGIPVEWWGYGGAGGTGGTGGTGSDGLVVIYY